MHNKTVDSKGIWNKWIKYLFLMSLQPKMTSIELESWINI